MRRWVINRAEEGYKFWKDPQTQDPKEWKRFGKRIRELTGGEDIDIVFEHPGRETFGASVYVTRKGGVITTCASTSGYMHEYDNRYLWMNLKRIISSRLRQLPRVVGGQPADREGHDPPDAPRASTGSRTPGRPRSTVHPTTPSTRARSASWRSPLRRGSGSWTRSCATSTPRSTGSAASDPCLRSRT